MKKLSPRVWLTLVLVGLVGQFAWTIENMYFNVYLYNTISTDPGYISAMVGWSAAAATLTTLLMGALSDRVGKRKLFICGGYLLWGLSTAAFGLVTVENAAKLFPAASAAAAAAVMIVVLDCVMTFFGSTANDAAFNAWITDTVPNAARGKAESVLAILPLISMLVIFGLFDSMTQRGQWQKFFAIFGGLVVLTGVVSIFLIPEPKLEPRRDSYLKNLVYGLRPTVAKENPALYLSFAAFCLFSVAVQVFFPYLIIYMQNYLHFDGYALVLGIVLIFASVVSVLRPRDRPARRTAVRTSGGRSHVRRTARHVLRAVDAGRDPDGLHYDVRLYAGHGDSVRCHPRPYTCRKGRTFSGHPHDLRRSAADDFRPCHRRSGHSRQRFHLC